ncbi:MAG: SDR family NAD(P)-dependent oxidoreductase [Proteobacteria bacterium]|nr:SDR family NAD(P)-dependent oxidoreductase [Pseudomonadota bacterium]
MRYIITGASEGLGAALGKLCHENGIEVVALSRSKPAYDCHHIVVDLTEQSSIDKAVEEIKKNYGSFDALVNCAGIMSVQKPENVTYAEMERLFQINLLAPIYLTSHLFELIKKNQADIVNVASTVGTKAYEDQCAYGASKWGLRGVSLNFQLELKNTPCRVIQFNPGGFKSKILEKATGEKKDLSKFMDPADLAHLLFTILKLPKSVEVTEILINRKT